MCVFMMADKTPRSPAATVPSYAHIDLQTALITVSATQWLFAVVG